MRARRGYFAPGRDEKAAKAEGRDAAIQRALDAPFDLPEVPLRAIAQVFGEAGPGKASVLLTAEADIRGLAFTENDGASRDTLEILLLVARRDTGEFTRFDQQFEMGFQQETRARFEETWFPITRELKLASRALPGEDRRPRPEQRTGREPDPRLRGARPRPASASRASS